MFTNRIAHLALPILVFASWSLPAFAGDYHPVYPRTPSPKSVLLDPIDERGWEIDLQLYGWLAAIDSQVGVGRLTTDVGLEWGDYSNLLDEVDLMTQGKLEVRKNRWGAIIDWNYLRLSDETSVATPLLDTVSVKIEMLLLDGALTYRVLEGDRGFLDVMAGARYWYLGEMAGLNVNSAAIDRFSRRTSQRVVDEATSRVREAVDAAIARARPIVAEQIEAAVRDQIGDIEVPGAIDRGNLLQGLTTTNAVGRAGERRTIRPGQFDRERGDLVRAIVAENTAAAQLKVGQVKASAQKQAQKKVAQAQRRLERAINKRLRSLPDEVESSQSWVDPYVGVIGKYFITEKTYLVGRADVGGFGVGSDLTWQATGAIGHKITERATFELGYKHLDVDLDKDGFIFDGYMSGFFVGVGIELR